VNRSFYRKAVSPGVLYLPECGRGANKGGYRERRVQKLNGKLVWARSQLRKYGLKVNIGLLETILILV
jgi:hypothetical protein